MLDENELLFNELYEKTKDCGRVQFIKLLMQKEREIQELRIQVSVREEVANKYKEVIDKLKEWIYIVQQNKDAKHLDTFISTDELDELLDILKEVE